MRFAVIGDKGLFGSELSQLLDDLEIPFSGLNRSNFNVTADPLLMVHALKGFDVVVNAIAFTAVDKAETAIDHATSVNGIYAGALAQASKINNSRFIQISTDYVFDGLTKVPYQVSDEIQPQNVYGRSKALGEALVSDSGADYSILRTAWLYGSGGRCFPMTISNLLDKNGSVRVVSDQYGHPTWTRDLATQVIEVAGLSNMPRIVHAVSTGVASWADFAREVAISKGMDPAVVVEITSQEYSTAAKRPPWSVLDNNSDELGVIGDWRERWKSAAAIVLGAS